MIRPLAALGYFIFSPFEGSYESLKKDWGFSWAKLDAIGSPSAKQWTGPQDHKVTLAGSVWPQLQPEGSWKIEKIAAFAGAGRPLALVGFEGQVYGRFVIDKISTDQKLIGEGGLPGEIGFTINLSSYA